MRHRTKTAALQLLRAYKWAISPLFPPACRYVPTCSDYAAEAIDRYGVLRGGLMAIARLLRCHPLARGGYDPVVKREGCDSPRSTDLDSYQGMASAVPKSTHQMIAPSSAAPAFHVARRAIRMER